MRIAIAVSLCCFLYSHVAFIVFLRLRADGDHLAFSRQLDLLIMRSWRQS